MEITTADDNILIAVCNVEQLETRARWKVFSTECSIRPIPNTNQIINLSGNMYYLFIVKPTILRILCGENSINKNISKSVLIKNFRRDCFVHFDDGWFTRLQAEKVKTIFQLSNGYSSYPIFENELIQKVSLNTDSFKPIRNLQSDFGELQEQIRNYIERPKIVTNILKSDELLIIIGIMIFLTGTTWTLIAYCNYQTKLKFSICEQNLSSDDSSSMSTINRDLRYNFKFSSPPLPRKTKSTRIIPKSPTDSYDIPKSNKTLSTALTKSMSTNENIPMVSMVEYAQVHEQPRSSV